jgi:N-acyl-D-aspartate/D-glutamate deacylase
MEYDLLVRGGRIVDGSGLPSYNGDIAIKDGKIVELGRINGGARKTLDVGGLAVAPGFIDHHTHMDAQLLWDPYATSEPQHGVTSIIAGNCGLALAPVKSGDEDALVKSFVRVEAIPRFALEKGVPWGWHSYRDYLGSLVGRLGINMGGLAGHIAVRQYVMGDESVERRATPAEVQRMQQLVRECMEAGAFGFSTNRNERHMREDGKPVPSRLADIEELLTLCEPLGELNAGVIQSTLGQYTPKNLELYDELARRTQRPVVGLVVVHRSNRPEQWKEQLKATADAFQKGYRTYRLCHTVPLVRYFDLKTTQLFDEFPTWKSLMFMDEPARKAAFADPETRQKLRADFADPRPTVFHRNWAIVRVEKVARQENQKYVGKTIADLAAMRGRESLDAFLDLSLEEDLQTVFWNANSGGDPEAMGQIMQSPYVLIGTSDAGAHVLFGANFGYATTLLGLWVREMNVLSLERAVHKLSFEVASVYGIEGRGLLRPGYAADLAIFDADKVNACEPEWSNDYPGGTKRMIQRSVGMHYTVVNGRVICEDGKITGELPGQVLRSSAYRPAA